MTASAAEASTYCHVFHRGGEIRVPKKKGIKERKESKLTLLKKTLKWVRDRHVSREEGQQPARNANKCIGSTVWFYTPANRFCFRFIIYAHESAVNKRPQTTMEGRNVYRYS